MRSSNLLRIIKEYGISFILCRKDCSIDVAINSAIINTKFAYVVGAKNKAAASFFKESFLIKSTGEPAVFFDSKLANDGT